MNARDAALAVLADARVGRRTARNSLDELIGRYRIDPADVGLAGELVWGVMRHRLTIEAVLRMAAGDKWKRLSHTLQHILLVAAYQLLWLDAVPAFAAIHEAVEQAKREGGRRAGGFVNAVLRTVQRHMSGYGDAGAADSRSRIPVGLGRSRRFDVPVLPDPAVRPVAYLAAMTSHPEVLLSRWLRVYGREKTEAICLAGTCRPPAVLRPNKLRIDAAALAERLRAEGCEVETAVDGTAVVLAGTPAGVAVWRLAAFGEGLFQPQDITAMQPVRMGDIESGCVVLDLCAGYGTKATQAAECMGDRGCVIATDSDARKLAALARNCERLGITCVRTVMVEALPATLAAQDRLDWILVDVPCSNTGVLARRPGARYRFSPQSVRSLAEVQSALLRQAAALARPETRILYSTCSIEPEENEDVVEAFCGANPEWQVVTSKLTLPRAGSAAIDWRDGGYTCLLARG